VSGDDELDSRNRSSAGGDRAHENGRAWNNRVVVHRLAARGESLAAYLRACPVFFAILLTVLLSAFATNTVRCPVDDINNAMFADATGVSVNAWCRDNSPGRVSLDLRLWGRRTNAVK